MATIRAATADDEGFLCEMTFLALYVPPGAEPFDREILKRPEISHYFEGFGIVDGDIGVVAIDDASRPLGACWCRRFTAEDPGYGWVSNDVAELSIAVTAPWRNRGLGNRLIGEVISMSKRNGASHLSLSVDKTSPAIRLYRRLGFVEVPSRDSTDGSTTMLLSLPDSPKR